jgi:hypothetical protein
MAVNPWAKGGKYYPNWIDEDQEFLAQHADFITGKRSIAPIREKNPLTDKWISEEELRAFEKILGRIPQGNPYEWLVNIFEKLTGLQFPELPADVRLQADWNKMFLIWFFEIIPTISNAYWSTNSKTIFNDNSLYCIDFVNSVSFSDINNKACIKHHFFNYSDDKRPNPLNASFSFTGPDSGKQNYYSWLEWFVGSYSTNIYWNKKENGSYDIHAKINNTSSWYSGTRLPKTWQDKIKKTIGFEIKNLVDSAPRGETIKRKLPSIIVKTLEYLGVIIPSFGGNWEQEFNVKTNWEA